MQQISQSIPPPEKPSPHTARKKIKTQKLKKETENTHQSPDKKEEDKKTEEQEERKRRQTNKKEEEVDRRTRKKNKKPGKKHKKEAQNNIQHKTKPNHEKQHVQASKEKITKQFLYLSIIPKSSVPEEKIYPAERKTPTYGLQKYRDRKNIPVFRSERDTAKSHIFKVFIPQAQILKFLSQCLI